MQGVLICVILTMYSKFIFTHTQNVHSKYIINGNHILIILLNNYSLPNEAVES